jgi:hypothetical protein
LRIYVPQFHDLSSTDMWIDSVEIYLGFHGYWNFALFGVYSWFIFPKYLVKNVWDVWCNMSASWWKTFGRYFQIKILQKHPVNVHTIF